MGHTKRKHVFGHILTANAQISLCIWAVWSGPTLSANRIIGYYRIYEEVWIILSTCAGWSESAQFAHVWRNFFRLTRPGLPHGAPAVFYKISKTYLDLLLHPLSCWVRLPGNQWWQISQNQQINLSLCFQMQLLMYLWNGRKFTFNTRINILK